MIHSTDEQLQEIMRRAEVVKEKRGIRKNLAVSAISSCVCILLLIAVSVRLHEMTTITEERGMQQYGSLLIAAPYIGYIIVGILAFILGICVMFLCIQWKALKQKDRDKP